MTFRCILIPILFVASHSSPASLSPWEIRTEGQGLRFLARLVMERPESAVLRGSRVWRE